MLLIGLAMATVWSVPADGPLNQVCANAENGDEILITEDQGTVSCDAEAKYHQQRSRPMGGKCILM